MTHYRRQVPPRSRVTAGLLALCLLAGVAVVGTGVPAGAASGSAATATSVPASPVGQQLGWLLSITRLPLSTAVIDQHFTSTFLAQVPPSDLNSVLGTLGSHGPVALLSLSDVAPTSLDAVIELGNARYRVQLGVDGAGLIDALYFKPEVTTPRTWSAVEDQVRSVAPDVSLLAARVNANGTCRGLDDLETATCAWVSWFNDERLHSELTDLTPAEVEAAHYASRPHASAA